MKYILHARKRVSPAAGNRKSQSALLGTRFNILHLKHCNAVLKVEILQIQGGHKTVNYKMLTRHEHAGVSV